MNITATCPECGATLRTYWEGGDTASFLCVCGAEPVFTVDTHVEVDLGALLYDERFAVRCRQCPTWLDSRSAPPDAGPPLCAYCARRGRYDQAQLQEVPA